MKAQGSVKGILFEGSDGHEYLLGFTPAQPVPAPILSRRQPDGRFQLIDDLQEASRVALKQLGTPGPTLIGPGWGKQLILWIAFGAALKAFPPIPSWPTWRA
ncbi:MAG: hypothetical protein ACREK9_14035 [Candidatus Rokuibacteriota bacterium]